MLFFQSITNPIEKAEIKLDFENFIVDLGKCKIDGTPPFLVIGYPNTATILNERESNRVKISDSTYSPFNRVVIHNESGIHLGKFKIQDISFDGFGGKLISRLKTKDLMESKVVGSIFFKDHWIPMKSEIKSIKKIEENPSGDNTYDIGLQNDKLTTIKDRRQLRSERFDVSFTLDVEFSIYPEKTFKLPIINASVSGFLAETNKIDLIKILKTSKLLNKKNSSLKAKLVSHDENQFRFKWTDGNPKDRLSWLKEVSYYSKKEVDTVGLGENEILSLFCQSGALSDSYIKSQKLLSDDFQKTFKETSGNEPWIYRAVDTKNQSQKKAYASSIQCGDNCWSIVDIVSDRYNENGKMSRDFFPRFICSFADYLKSLEPCPKVLISWAKGHPYYKKFESQLESQNIISKVTMQYTRNSEQSIQSHDPQVLVQMIKATDFNEIKEIQSRLYKHNLKDLADSFDFNFDNFKSPRLKSFFKEYRTPFKRQYFKFSIENFSFLAVFSLIPEGYNPGRYIDSIFVFDLNDHDLDAKKWDKVKNALFYVAASNSYSTHAIRRLTKKETTLDEKEIVNLTTYLFHPDAFEYFRRQLN